MKKNKEEIRKVGTPCVAVALVIACIGTICILADAEGDNDTYLSDSIVTYCEDIGKQYSICPELLEAMIEAESSGNPNAVNGNCVGLMQISTTAQRDRMKRLGVANPYDEYSNILVGTDYLAELFDEYEDLPTVLMLYNGQSNAVAKGDQGKWSAYADKIMKRSEQLERTHGK